MKQEELRQVRGKLNRCYFLCENGEAKRLIQECIESVHSAINNRKTADLQSWPALKFTGFKTIEELKTTLNKGL